MRRAILFLLVAASVWRGALASDGAGSKAAAGTAGHRATRALTEVRTNLRLPRQSHNPSELNPAHPYCESHRWTDAKPVAGGWFVPPNSRRFQRLFGDTNQPPATWAPGGKSFWDMSIAFTGFSDTRGWDTKPDTWFAIDGLGRQTPSNPPAPREGRFVAMFYFLWLGQEGDFGPFDNAKILAQHPDALQHPDDPLWGPEARPHHWGESVFGYYRSTDEWVLRKHAQMLSDAQVDTVVFDNSNRVTYPDSYLALCRVWSQVRSEGGKTPQIAFLAPFGDPGSTVRKLWEEFYSKGLYRDLWFRWKRKPLILADPDQITTASLGSDLDSKAAATELETIKGFFTFRKPQPDYFQGPTGPNEWSWLEVYPQHMFRDQTSLGEQMSVGVAQNAVDGKLSVLSNPLSLGRSSVDSKPAPPDKWDTRGENFQQQWDRAIKADPEIVFVTGWNEWIAGRFGASAPFSAVGPVNFVDEFDAEHSRDIEPSNGPLSDNFYYELVDNVRQYKGARPVQVANGRREIDIQGPITQWDVVQPEYRDDRFDAPSRDERGWGSLHYANTTARNDLVAFKVAEGKDRLVLLAESQSDFANVDFGAPLTLWLRIPGSESTDSLGFSYRVRYFGRADGFAVFQTFLGSGWARDVKVRCRLVGKSLQVEVPNDLIGFHGELEFKWTDNIDPEVDPLNLYRDGDTAPNGRFCYVFKTAGRS